MLLLLSTIDFFFLCCLKFLERFELVDSFLLFELTKEFYTRVNQYCYRSVILTKTTYSVVIFTFSLRISKRYNKQSNFDCLNLITRKNNNSCCEIRKEELQKIKIKLLKRVCFDTPISAKSRLIQILNKSDTNLGEIQHRFWRDLAHYWNKEYYNAISQLKFF